MLDTLFAMPLAVRFFIAFIVVLALIALTAWLVRRFAANRLGGGGARGRQPRLAVIEAANVDARRRLLLIRRDNMEHLLMIGGPTDIVVEPNIVRAPVAREPARADTTWPLQPVNEPPARTPIVEDQWPPETPVRSRPPEPRAGVSAPLSQRPSPELAPISPKPEPRTPAPPVEGSADHNLAEMANQLEAALRREPKTSEPPRPPREVKMRIDPRIESRNEPRIENRPEPKLDVRGEPKMDAPAAPKPLFTPIAPEPMREPKLDMKPEPIAPKPEARPEPASRQDFYDNLEEEMASLLGRPSGKS